MNPKEILYIVPCNHAGTVDLGLNVLNYGDDLWIYAADYYDSEDPKLDELRSQALVTPLKLSEAFGELKDSYPMEMQKATAIASSSMQDILTAFFFQNADMFACDTKPATDVKIEVVGHMVEEAPAPTTPPEIKPIPAVVDAVTNSNILKRIDELFAVLQQQQAPAVPEIVEPLQVNATPRLDKDAYVELLNPLLEKCTSETELNDLLFKFFDTFVSSIGNVPDTISVYDYVVEKMLEV